MTKATVLSLETCPHGGHSPPAPAPPTPPAPPPPCKAKLDVVIVLDGSASIVPSDWQRALAFTNKLVSGFNISTDEVNLGVVQFSSRADQVIGLSADKAAITAAITSLQQMKMNTNTYEGFSVAKDMLDKQGRPTAKGKLVILLTDGIQNSGRPAKIMSDALQAEGAQVFGIGVGSQIDQKELQSWCSQPLSSHYFTVGAFSQLEKILQQIIASACPHPPAMLAVAASPRSSSPGKMCRFHLPSGLPSTLMARSRAAVESSEPRESEVSSDAPAADNTPDFTATRAHVKNGTDPCATHSNCSSCIAAHEGGLSCGWCTGTILGTHSQCAGREQGAPPFTCTGHYQTTTCEAPGDCGLKGLYRGLRIGKSRQAPSQAAAHATAVPCSSTYLQH